MTMTTTMTTTAHTETIRNFEVTYSLKVMAAKSKGFKAAIIELTSAIHEKTNVEAIFYPISTVYPKPEPIKNIITNFPSMTAKLDDFFQVVEIKNTYSVQFYLAISFSGMTDMELHESLKNTLKHNNLWLASKEILAKTIDDIDFVENCNPEYTNSKELEIAIEATVMELVATDSSAVATHSRMKGPKFIISTSKKIYGTNAVTEAIVIRTTDNYYGPALQLLGMISNKIGPHYVIHPKTLKKQLDNGGWDQLL